MKSIVLGVDIGGSHITSALIDLENKSEIKNSWFRSRLDSSGTVSEIIEAWAVNINHSIDSYPTRPAKISIAMPGPMDYKNGICLINNQDKYQSLYGINIKDKLTERLGISPKDLNFMNDAACFLKGEVFSGSLKGFDNAIGLTLGTGLGTSHTQDGMAYDSDLWKMPFLDGIAEDYISTRWFIMRFEELAGLNIKDVKDLVDNHKSSPYFDSIFLEFSINLAKFIHRFIRKKMPLAAVIGGNIVHAEVHFLDNTRKHLAEMIGYSFPLERSVLGERAALIGAGASF